MKNLLRRVRGFIGMGLTWSAGFIAFMTGYALILGQFAGFVSMLPLFGSIGFLMGGTFGGFLALTERSKRLEDLSLRRVALWGGLGGAIAITAASLMLGAFPPWGFFTVLTGVSAAFAAGQVAIARTGGESLIEGGGDADLLSDGD